MSIIRTRWAAIGAAVAVTLGAGGIGIVSATQPDVAVAFVAITPCRVMDTRAESNVGPKATPLGPGETHTVNTTTSDTGNCTDIPATATGVSLNLTALDATLPTFLTVWSTGVAQPAVSSLNPVPGAPPTPNAVTTAISADGQFDVFNLQGNVHVIADVNGYYTDHHHDERYYTKSQTDSAIVDALDGLPSGTPTVRADIAALKSRISALESALGAVSDPSGNWTFPGNATIAGSLSVNGPIAAGGDVAFGRTLSVGQGLAVGDDVTIEGGVSINGTFAAGGDAALGRTLSVGQGLAVGDDVTIGGGVSINGPFAAGGDVAFGRTLSIGQDLAVGGGLGVGGSIDAGGNVTTEGNFIDETP